MSGSRFLVTALAAIVIAAVTSTVLGPAQPAAAAGDQLRLTVNGRPTQEGLDSSALANLPMLPHDRETLLVRARNASSRAAELTVRLTDLTSREVGCLSRERLAGDMTCGSAQGEGTSSLWLRVRRIHADGTMTHIRASSVRTYGDVVVVENLAAKAVAAFEVVLFVPGRVGDIAQTDAADFNMVWTLRELPTVAPKPPKNKPKPSKPKPGRVRRSVQTAYAAGWSPAGPAQPLVAPPRVAGAVIDTDVLATTQLAESRGEVSPLEPAAARLLWVGLPVLLALVWTNGRRPRRRQTRPTADNAVDMRR